MKTLLILPLFLGSIAAFTQSEIHFLNCDETNQNCVLNLSEVEELQLKHYNQARIFFFKNIDEGKTQELAVVDERINFQVPEATKVVLVKLKNTDGIDHIWLNLPSVLDTDEVESKLIRAQLFAGAHQQLTGIESDLTKANEYFEDYKSNTDSKSEKLYSSFYWQAQIERNPEVALAEMVFRSRQTNKPDEMDLLIKEMTGLGDTLYSQQLTNRLLTEFPEHPISIEMNTWDLRKQSYLSKDGASNYQLYKEYLKQTSTYRSARSKERIENHKAQFLVNLYQHYWDMDYSWLAEVSELSPTNQVYVYSITGRGLMESSPLEAYGLVDRALEISKESLIKDLGNDHHLELLTTLEKEHLAEKCKDLAYYLKGKLWLSEDEPEMALQSFQKAVTLNEYIVEDYNKAYAQSLKNAEKWAELESFLCRVADVYPLSPALQKFASLKTTKGTVELSKEAPQLSFSDDKGKIYELGQNGLELLDIWSSDCESCMKSFPDLYFLQRTFAGELTILSIPTDDIKMGQSTLQERGFETFTTLAPNLLISLQEKFDFKGEQAKLLVDNNGKVLYKKVGKFSQQDLDELQSTIKSRLEMSQSK